MPGCAAPSLIFPPCHLALRQCQRRPQSSSPQGALTPCHQYCSGSVGCRGLTSRSLSAAMCRSLTAKMLSSPALKHAASVAAVAAQKSGRIAVARPNARASAAELSAKMRWVHRQPLAQSRACCCSATREGALRWLPDDQSSRRVTQCMYSVVPLVVPARTCFKAGWATTHIRYCFPCFGPGCIWSLYHTLTVVRHLGFRTQGKAQALWMYGLVKSSAGRMNRWHLDVLSVSKICQIPVDTCFK